MDSPRRFRSVAFLVDPSMYAEAYAPPRDVYGDLDRVIRTDLYYHYSTPICAQRWLDVCEDPAYGHKALLDRVRDVMPRVVAALREDGGGRSAVELCSLGPGDGSVDERMLEGLAEGFSVRGYTGLDFSFELLRRSVHRLAQSPDLPQDLSIRAVCGDFTDLSAVTLGARAPDAFRVFGLTGFTFGNYPETDLLRNIGGLMEEGDYLFFDARLHGLGPLPDDLAPVQSATERTQTSYDVASVRSFVTGPLEVATTQSGAPAAVSYELARSLTTIPNALNLVIYCTGLDATLRLTGERIRRDRVDLAVTTSYHLPDLVAWIRGSGFTLVWDRSVGDVAFFLLRK